jgi:hypothetical protein
MLSERQKMELALASGSALRTVCRCYRGLRVYRTTHERIVRAAQQLGYVLPPEPLPRNQPELGLHDSRVRT